MRLTEGIYTRSMCPALTLNLRIIVSGHDPGGSRLSAVDPGQQPGVLAELLAGEALLPASCRPQAAVRGDRRLPTQGSGAGV